MILAAFGWLTGLAHFTLLASPCCRLHILPNHYKISIDEAFPGTILMAAIGSSYVLAMNGVILTVFYPWPVAINALVSTNRVEVFLSFVLAVNRLKVMAGFRYSDRLHMILAALGWLIGMGNFTLLASPCCRLHILPNHYKISIDEAFPGTILMATIGSSYALAMNGLILTVLCTQAAYRKQDCYRLLMQISITEMIMCPGYILIGLSRLIGFYPWPVAINALVSANRAEIFLSFVLAINRLKVMAGFRYSDRLHMILAAIGWLIGMVNFTLLVSPCCRLHILPNHYKISIDEAFPGTILMASIGSSYVLAMNGLILCIYVVLFGYMIKLRVTQNDNEFWVNNPYISKMFAEIYHRPEMFRPLLLVFGLNACAVGAFTIGQPVNGDFTYYNDAGYGACGTQINAGTEDLVAVSSTYWTTANSNDDPLCSNVCVRVSYNGKTITVPVKDKCPSCDWQHIDLSQTAFAQLADINNGHIFGAQWSFEHC
ncbi:hypothetical protein QR680_015555 [Steinernema hermaphroditum]|uniref:RlpA-like protein double-psi beta-barrel domain-containing protein n=1 Tax=Steinernema hermaphroditum TaxID=289476 RepID=A0AA39H8G3_9BILA|nr:hypothetical protein QR680_015555 [Steinernema hermaphroditum]